MQNRICGGALPHGGASAVSGCGVEARFTARTRGKLASHLREATTVGAGLFPSRSSQYLQSRGRPWAGAGDDRQGADNARNRDYHAPLRPALFNAGRSLVYGCGLVDGWVHRSCLVNLPGDCGDCRLLSPYEIASEQALPRSASKHPIHSVLLCHSAPRSTL